MQKSKNTQHGFAHIGIILILFVVALVGVVGWRVIEAGKNKNKVSTPTNNAAQNITNELADFEDCVAAGNPIDFESNNYSMFCKAGDRTYAKTKSTDDEVKRINNERYAEVEAYLSANPTKYTGKYLTISKFNLQLPITAGTQGIVIADQTEDGYTEPNRAFFMIDEAGMKGSIASIIVTHQGEQYVHDNGVESGLIEDLFQAQCGKGYGYGPNDYYCAFVKYGDDYINLSFGNGGHSCYEQQIDESNVFNQYIDVECLKAYLIINRDLKDMITKLEKI